jgi:hypothetical protein
VSQLSLGDYAERVGLVSGLGRRRRAFDAYREAAPAIRVGEEDSMSAAARDSS